jgi:hypothetical protein
MVRPPEFEPGIAGLESYIINCVLTRLDHMPEALTFLIDVTPIGYVTVTAILGHK